MIANKDTDADAPQIRQLAAVELRKRVTNGNGKLWTKTPEPVRGQIKANILTRLTQEPT